MYYIEIPYNGKFAQKKAFTIFTFCWPFTNVSTHRNKHRYNRINNKYKGYYKNQHG